MLKVDFRRMFTTPLFYIMVGVCLVIPVLILVMTTMMAGTTSVDPTTGVETTIEGFTNVWQSIGSVSGEGAAMSMDLTGMCNINMLYFLVAVFVCLFVSEDFRSGYSKNLFTVRARKSDYVISKTLAGFVGGAFMILAYFVGAVLGGAISGLSFDVGTAGIDGIVMCLLSKIFLVAVFVPIYLAVSVAAKQKTWLSIVGSFCIGMLLFTMIPMMTPLDSTIMNVVMCLVGGALFSVGLGAGSNLILRKTNLV
ncbi:MAG: ABC transporter permease [Eubacteriales bacterium]